MVIGSIGIYIGRGTVFRTLIADWIGPAEKRTVRDVVHAQRARFVPQTHNYDDHEQLVPFPRHACFNLTNRGYHRGYDQLGANTSLIQRIVPPLSFLSDIASHGEVVLDVTVTSLAMTTPPAGQGNRPL